MPALPRQLSSLQPSFLPPACFLPEAGCPLPSRAQPWFWVTCHQHRWLNARKNSGKHEAFLLFGLFSATGRKSDLPPLPCQGQYPQIPTLISMQDMDREGHLGSRPSEPSQSTVIQICYVEDKPTRRITPASW